MAQLSGTQKKQKKSFIVMIIAIIVVLAAIAYVLFGGLTRTSSLIGNQKFATALSEVLGKAPAFISEEDLASVKYLALQKSDNEYYIAISKSSDFVDAYNKYSEDLDNGTETDVDIESLLKTSSFKAGDNDTFDEIKYFTGLDMIELISIALPDSSVFSGMTSLINARVYDCGLTEVNGFANLDADAVDKLYLVGNDVEDWSPLDYIQDKVTVTETYGIDVDEDGNYSLVPQSQTLREYYEAQAEAEAEAEAEENSEEAVEGEEGEEAEEAEETEEAEESVETSVEASEEAEAVVEEAEAVVDTEEAEDAE